jgi:hypothetical protein
LRPRPTFLELLKYLKNKNTNISKIKIKQKNPNFGGKKPKKGEQKTFWKMNRQNDT